MYKQSSGRNNRSKGFKIKHVIQLFVLVAICLWLIYQVKHSHDKKREFEGKNIKTPSSLSNGAGDEVIKFGRKDVQTRFEKTTLVTDGKVEEAEGGVQEDNTNEEDEQEEDIKHEEKEVEGRGGGDDEIDENNQHKFDMELEREVIDEKDAEGKDTEDDAEDKDTEDDAEDKDTEDDAEDKDTEDEEVERSEEENSEEVERSRRENSEEVERSRRENSEEVERSRRENSEEVERSEIENFEEGQRESENSEEGQTERENSGEGQREREEEDHEAREEHYKADDASSAVAHETENESLEKLNERSPTEEESSNNVEEVKAGRQNSVQGNQTVGNDIPQNDVTANGRSSLNSTTKVEKGIGLKEGNDLIEMGIENSGAPSGGEAKNLQQKSAFYTSPISSNLKAINNFTTQLEEEKTQETSQTIVHESASKGNTTTGAELDHSEAVVEGDAAAGETNKSGSELESDKEDPNSDSSLSDPIDSLDSSSSHLESSSSVHDHVGEDNIIRTMEGSINDTTTTMK